MFASYFAFPAGVIGTALLLLKNVPPNRQMPVKSCESKGRLAVGDGGAPLPACPCEAGENANMAATIATDPNIFGAFIFELLICLFGTGTAGQIGNMTVRMDDLCQEAQRRSDLRWPHADRHLVTGLQRFSSPAIAGHHHR